MMTHSRLSSLCLLLALCLAARPVRGAPQASGSSGAVEPSAAREDASERAPELFGWQPGQLLPDLELPRIDGQGSLRLSSLRGRRLLLIQFASW